MSFESVFDLMNIGNPQMQEMLGASRERLIIRRQTAEQEAVNLERTNVRDVFQDKDLP